MKPLLSPIGLKATPRPGAEGPSVPVSHHLDAAERSAWQAVNQSPFMFHHDLGRHPLFELPRLMRLAAMGIAQGRADAYLSDEELALPKPVRARQMLDKMEGLAEGRHWLKIPEPDHIDPEYAQLLQDMLAEIEALSGAAIHNRMTCFGMEIFLNSPHLQVPYHFDHDTNFLLQISGEKDDTLFDPHDRSVLTEAELEDFYRGNKLAGRFRESILSAGTRHHLAPGLGVHHPPLAPHLICNGDEVSISVAIYFVLPEQERLARVYQSNHFMRKLGLHPHPPGHSKWADWLKTSAMEAFAMSHPHSFDERLYGCVKRLGAPSRMARRVTGLFRPH